MYVGQDAAVDSILILSRVTDVRADSPLGVDFSESER